MTLYQVLEYLQIQGRPFGSTDVAANMVALGMSVSVLAREDIFKEEPIGTSQRKSLKSQWKHWLSKTCKYSTKVDRPLLASRLTTPAQDPVQDVLFVFHVLGS